MSKSAERPTSRNQKALFCIYIYLLFIIFFKNNLQVVYSCTICAQLGTCHDKLYHCGIMYKKKKKKVFKKIHNSKCWKFWKSFSGFFHISTIFQTISSSRTHPLRTRFRDLAFNAGRGLVEFRLDKNNSPLIFSYDLL